MQASRTQAALSEMESELELGGLELCLSRFLSDYTTGMSKFSRLHKNWDNGHSQILPATERFPKVNMTVAELCEAAHVTDFTVRRVADGVQPSRPIVYDGLLLVDRVASCFELVDCAITDCTGLIRSLRLVVDCISVALFELASALLDYLFVHVAPDVNQGRDAPDNWLDIEETMAIRHQLLARAVHAHRWQLRLDRLDRGSVDHNLAKMNAQRILLHVQVAFNGDEASFDERLAESDWPVGDEFRRITAGLESQAYQSSGAQSQAILASGFVAFAEGGSGSIESILSDAADVEGLQGRQLVALLRGVMPSLESTDMLVAAVSRILDEVDKSPSNEKAAILAGAHLEVLIALARIAIQAPADAAMVAQRLAHFPDGSSIPANHVWLVPGVIPVAIVKIGRTVTAIQLPLLADLELLQKIIDHHAEEYDKYFVVEIPGLRKKMSEAIQPLRDVVSTLEAPFTVHAFGILKHVPLAALKGKGSILAVKPTCKVLAPVGPGRNRGVTVSQRLFVVDTDLAQAEKLPRGDQFRTLQFDSRPSGGGAVAAFEEVRRTSVRELVYFGHGFVVQQQSLTGLVLSQGEGGFGLVPSSAIREFDLSGVELALIMACGAGQGSVYLEPSLSVGHAFRYAGARNVIAPQWPIDGKVGFDFCEKFFVRIEEGEDYVQAWSNVVAEDPNRFISIALFGD